MSIQMSNTSVTAPSVVARVGYRPPEVVTLGARIQTVVQTLFVRVSLYVYGEDASEMYNILFDRVIQIDITKEVKVQYQALLPPIYTTFYMYIGGLNPQAFTTKHAMREEIPFERFFFDYGINGDALNKSRWATLKARGVAVIHTLEGVVRAIAHRIEGAVKRVLERNFSYNFKVTSKRHYEVYQAQKVGLKYSLKSIINPKGAIVLAFWEGKIGAEFDSMHWGTLYQGKRNFLIFGHYTDRRV